MRAIAIALLACAAGSIGVPAASATGGFGQAVPGRALLAFAPEEIGKLQTYTTAQAVEQAGRWDVIVAQPQTFSASIGQMHAANPQLVVLGYMKGMMALPTEGSSWPAADYSYDAAGKKITNLQYGTYLMNPSSADWVASRVSACQSLLASSGYDGCMLDSLGAGPLKNGYDSGLPINPATGQVWTKSAWLAANAALAQSVRSAVASALVVGNSLLEPNPSTPPDLSLLSGIDGGIAEGFMRAATAPVTAYPTETVWKQTVDMIPAASAQAKPVLALTKLWATATPDQVTAWHLYTLASFLLGTDGTDSYYFTSTSADHPVLTTQWTVDIGDPTVAYALTDGVYQRPFTNGLVLVNPTPNDVVVPLAGSYVDPLGQPVLGSVDMPPTSGQILTQTPFTTPGAPSNLVATAGSGSAQLTWAAAPSPLGDPLISYTVAASDLTNLDAGQSLVTAATAASFAGLTTGDVYQFTVTATNAIGDGPVSAPSNQVVPRQPLVVTTASPLPWALQGLAYSTPLTATLGAPPYTWTQTGGSLPTGLSVTKGGYIKGTPAASGSYVVTVQASDTQKPPTTGTGDLALTVYPQAVAGVETISPSTAKAGSSNHIFKLTYQLDPGGAVNGGRLVITVPAGWTAPGTGASSRGRVTTTQGTVSVSGQQITVAGIKQLPGASITVTYGNTGNKLAGVAVPGAGSYAFATSAAATAAGALVPLAVSPVVSVS